MLALALCLAACAGNDLGGHVSGLKDRIKQNWEAAYKCAPHELAMAESHLAFAEQELHEGDYYRARQELDIASTNAKEAIRKSPPEKCLAQPIAERKDTDGDGLFDDEDACPNEPEDKDGFQDQDGCPDLDNDGDGIPDKLDKCPNDPEDKDGFQDEDGCPDPNNDGDKLLDKDDKCPNEYADTPDGCPKKYQLITVTAEKIELKQTIFFDFAKATIKPVSYPLLNEVALALKDNATIRVRVEGHTDSRGNAGFNLKLSQKRAESVVKYLVAQGTDGSRMEPRGFGKTVPIADNRTDAGRAQNRRVEFIILGR
jgi:outer membrane protein OmpA-like peptidoglycan-associated protein